MKPGRVSSGEPKRLCNVTRTKRLDNGCRQYLRNSIVRAEPRTASSISVTSAACASSSASTSSQEATSATSSISRWPPTIRLHAIRSSAPDMAITTRIRFSVASPGCAAVGGDTLPRPADSKGNDDERIKGTGTLTSAMAPQEQEPRLDHNARSGQMNPTEVGSQPRLCALKEIDLPRSHILSTCAAGNVTAARCVDSVLPSNVYGAQDSDLESRCATVVPAFACLYAASVPLKLWPAFARTQIDGDRP